MYSQFGNCPHCNISWDGGPIPENSRKYYSEPYRWSKIIGISSLEKDCLIAYKCPNCTTQFKLGDITREWPV